MESKLNIRKTIIYTILITPLIVSVLEITLQVIYSKRFNIISKSIISKIDKRINLTRFASISGWTHNCEYINYDHNFPNEVICNKHGLVKTPFIKSNTNEDIIGILLLGNSVAMGEGLYSRNNINTFASQLEIHLRQINSNIDLVNAAYSGFNSWQEHLETVRYLNSEPLFDDLPKLSMIVSFGGIQDFWNFLRLLVNSDIKTTNDYRVANGMMIQEMAQIWSCNWGAESLQVIAKQLAKAAIAQGVVEWSGHALLSVA